MDSVEDRDRTLRQVLVIEGDAAVRSLTFTNLARLECDSETAEHGRQALAKIRRESFDAVLIGIWYILTSLQPRLFHESMIFARTQLAGYWCLRRTPSTRSRWN